MPNVQRSIRCSRGFTLIELVVSIAIFAAMTALVMARYGSFNQNTLLTNMAYDMALSIRTAQSYGVSVKSADGINNNFNSAYGIHFDASPSKSATFTFFLDKNKTGVYDPTGGLEDITTYTLTSGAKILSICLASSVPDTSCNTGSDQNLSNSSQTLDITFRRPNPDAIFTVCPSANSVPNACSASSQPVALITLISSDRSNTQVVVVRKNGEISVGN